MTLASDVSTSHHCWNTGKPFEFIINLSAIDSFSILVNELPCFFDQFSLIRARILYAKLDIVRTAKAVEAKF